MNRDRIINRLTMAATAIVNSGRIYNINLELAENIKKRLFSDKSELYSEQYKAGDQMRIRFQFSEDGMNVSVPSLVEENLRPIYITYAMLPMDQLRAMTELI
jgi:hypothetical protein